MSKLQLPDVTLVAVTDVNVQLTIQRMNKCMDEIDFGDVKLISGIYKNDTERFKIIEVDRIKSKRDYSYFLFYELHKYINTSHFLIVQWDGTVENPDAWKPEYLDYDYIGAIWGFREVRNEPFLMGNGGFSLRSKRLHEHLSKDPNLTQHHPEDGHICITYRTYLESLGFKFASNELAKTFAVEHQPYTGQFGWHGGLEPMRQQIVST